MRLKDKVAIVTGAGRGIGRATALLFAKEGANVVVADLDLDVVTTVADEINGLVVATNGQVHTTSEHPINGHSNGGHATADASVTTLPRALAVQVNVADGASCQAMAQAALDCYGRVDIIVNNAGIVRDAQLVKMQEDQFDAVIDVNLKGVYNCAQAVAPQMIQQGSGVILSTASIVAAYGNFGQTNYVASKAGVVGMTKVWARELGRKGIRVNAVAPGFIRTRMTDGIPDKVMESIEQRIPLGYRGEPEDIANAYLWLASDEARYVNGHILAVDGGAVI
ncbi:MAG: SDR family oxidoreductase [Caldilineaceae bacterium]|nr:SDR family oxidoreductase [Caldilineaceae bacterium]